MATRDPLSYVDYDFDNLVTDLNNRLKVTDEWKDTYESSTGQMLIEFLAYLFNLVLFKLERQAEEGYIGTAQNKSSIVNLVRLINYTPKRKVSATGELTFTRVEADLTKRIFIPQYTECQTSSALKFVTMSDTTIEPGSASKTISAIQGELEVLEFTSDGSSDQEFSIDDTDVENDEHAMYRPFYSFRVIVDGVEWSRVTSFLSSGPTDTDYQLRAELDDTLTLIFGDDVKGKIPTLGATVQVKYIRSDGSDGNAYSTGVITTINDTIYDEDGTEVDLTVTNSTTMSGGDDAEDSEEIRAEAPSVFATGDRAVTKEDFEAILMNYESIADVNVWGEAEESPPNYNLYNTIRLAIILDDWNLPTDSFKSTLSTYLYKKSMITVKYEFIEVDILDVIVSVELWAVAGNDLSQVQSDVEDVLAAEFTLGTTTRIGDDKRLSNLIDAVDSLTSISYHHMTLQIRKDLTAQYQSGVDYGEILGGLPIKPSSVEVYATVDETTGVLMATDDGAGGFTDLSSDYVVTGSIDYDTGLILVEFEPDTYISQVYVVYESDADGDITTSTREICKLYSVEVDSIAYDT